MLYSMQVVLSMYNGLRRIACKVGLRRMEVEWLVRSRCGYLRLMDAMQIVLPIHNGDRPITSKAGLRLMDVEWLVDKTHPLIHICCRTL